MDKIIGNVEGEEINTPDDMTCCGCRETFKYRLATLTGGGSGFGHCNRCGREFSWFLSDAQRIFSFTYKSTPEAGFEYVDTAKAMAHKGPITRADFNHRLVNL